MNHRKIFLIIFALGLAIGFIVGENVGIYLIIKQLAGFINKLDPDLVQKILKYIAVNKGSL